MKYTILFVNRCFWTTFDCLKENYAFLQCLDSLQNLEVLNLNGCQKISDKGIEAITSACPNLKVFSIYWNVRCVRLISISNHIASWHFVHFQWILECHLSFRVTDIGIAHLVKNCKHIVDLNFSGCKVSVTGSHPTSLLCLLQTIH